MGLISMNISKEGEKRRYLPLEIRMQMYEDVIELRKQELTYKEIQRKIYEKYGEQISIQNIYNWIRGKHHPLGNVNKFDKIPSPELTYTIGTTLGDGCKYFYNQHYSIQLSVKDKEFAEEFGKCLAKVLNRKEPYKPFWNKNQSRWIITACSIFLYKFLDKPLEELKPYIEYSKDTVSAFLRALFDGEGSIPKHRRILFFYNVNKDLLIYVQYLLRRYFDIDTTGPHLVRRSDKVMYFSHGIVSKTTEDYYYIYIRTNSLLNFYKYIGFTIKRKKERLIDAIKQ